MSDLTQFSAAILCSTFALDSKFRKSMVLSSTLRTGLSGEGWGRANTAKYLFEAPMEAIETGPAVSCFIVKLTGLSQVNN